VGRRPRKAPPIVVIAPCSYHLANATEQTCAVLAELATTPAGRNNEVWAIDADAYVVRPGHRLVDGLELLAWIIARAEGDPHHRGHPRQLTQRTGL
jgi:iron complex transport system substrate-binding protein